MKNKIKLAFLNILLISIFSCNKEVEIDIDEGAQKIVLNTWLKEGESPQLQVSYSSFIFEKTGVGYLDNATVILREEGTKIGELSPKGEGFYGNENIILKDGSQYQFEVSHEKYLSVFSNEKIPTKLEDDELEIHYEINPNTGFSSNSYRSNINIDINDDPKEENYYLARVAQYDTYWSVEEEDTTTYKGYAYMEPIDPQTLEAYIPNFGACFILSDEIFNGKDYKMRLGGFNDIRKFEQSDDSSFYQTIYYEIEFHKINRALYLYLRSIDNNQYPGPFTEPTQMYSNVENGYGIVGTSSFTKYVIEETKDYQFQ